MKIAFLITAVWWVAFSIPLIRDVHQTHYKERAPHLIRDTFSGLLRTLKRIWKDRRLRYFMLAFFCYIDGVHTIIKMSTSYGTDLGIDATQLVLALLVTQFVAFPSAIATGACPRSSARSACCWWPSARTSASRCSRRSSCARPWSSGSSPSALACSRAASRRCLVPNSASSSRRSTPTSTTASSTSSASTRVMGTFLVSLFTQLSGNSSLGVLSIAVLFVVGFVLLLRMPEKQG